MSEEETDKKPFHVDMEEGYYDAKPVVCGIKRVKDKKTGEERARFAIECAIEIHESGEVRIVKLVKFGTLEGDNPEVIGYTMQDAETCGCDTSLGVEDWVVDPKRKVRVKVEQNDEFGTQLRSIFPAGDGPSLISKSLMSKDELQASGLASALNDRLAFIRQNRSQGGNPQPSVKRGDKPAGEKPAGEKKADKIPF